MLESLEDRAVPAAIQLIHNSPYEAAEVVDVYVNDVLVADDFTFRSASGFLDLTPFLGGNDTATINVDITAGDADDNSDPVFEADIPIENGVNYIGVAIGDPGSDGSTPAFTVALATVGQIASGSSDEVDLLVFHGSPDAPEVDVVARDVGILVDDISYTEFNQTDGVDSYISVPPATFTLDVTLADDNDVVAATFEADLSGLGGGAAVVLASGFLAPEPGEDNFGLLTVLPDGTAFLLPVVVEGTRFSDVFTVDVEEGDTNTLQIQRTFGDTTEFTLDPNQPIIIDAGRGFDRLYYNAASADLELPDITFRGGRFRDAVVVLGTDENDIITIANAANGYALEVNGANLFATSVESFSVYGRGGADYVDASGLLDRGVYLAGGEGNDTLIGGALADFIFGGDGDDSIRGGSGRDFLFGEDGNDELFGEGGTDILSGGRGSDFLDGGAGFDLLFGGFGRDTLTRGFGF